MNIVETLKQHNFKITPQRLAVYNYLQEHHTHPSAEEIYENLKNEYSSLSLGTVYKTLKCFVDLNLIQEIRIDSDCVHYDDDTSFHVHLFCNKCKKIYDYHDFGNLKSFEKMITRQTNFQIESEQLFFFGLCNNCF